jgi:hypothetical protein
LPVRAPIAVLSLVLAIIAGLLPSAAPTAAAATLKVAIIVGPTEITDSNYLPSAQQIETTAIASGAAVDLAYCATPDEAKAAANGANIIVYLGHGNGFPNPYSSTLLTDRTNGWGLRNPDADWTEGEDPCDDAVLRYFGQDHLTGKASGNGWSPGPITPAPGFVMVYSNACYAPGAGESRPAPAESVAVSRVAHYSRPILELGGTYFATDLGSRHLVDLLLRNRDESFGRIFEQGNGFVAESLRRYAHPLVTGSEAWVHRTTSKWLGDDYWYAFAGNPARTPNGGVVPYSGPRVGLMFTDIDGSAFAASILWMADRRITTGCGAGRFCPRASVTREQMASFLVRALQLPATATDSFGDDDGSAHQADINRLAASGVTGGCAPGRFCPAGTVTREQMASFLVRALQLPATTTDYFTDDDGSAHEADINRLAASGITGGCSATSFCPKASITREQMAAFLHRALGP